MDEETEVQRGAGNLPKFAQQVRAKSRVAPRSPDLKSTELGHCGEAAWHRKRAE